MKHSITSSKGDDFESRVFRYLRNELKIDCQRVRQRTGSAPRPRGMLQSQVIITCERPSLFVCYPKRCIWVCDE
ncbi:7123_t:CDS:2 [Dentiscutata heterogama]|uniref:7123_t:CDS:1 n=1 Tax=Dentiscutata heterogama TaxID=1316150 RepID=A0ACA9KY37_9GLOM|nr:7123_t:CDS:2 [Dentiscutata heterogama]